MLLDITGILFAAQLVALLTIGPYADYGHWRPWIMICTLDRLDYIDSRLSCGAIEMELDIFESDIQFDSLPNGSLHYTVRHDWYEPTRSMAGSASAVRRWIALYVDAIYFP